jgi:hypothetical protein
MAFGFVKKWFSSTLAASTKTEKDEAAQSEGGTYPVLVSRAAMEIVDALDKDGGCGAYSGKSLSEMRSEYPDLEEMSNLDANQLLDELSMGPPEEITELQWHTAFSMQKQPTLSLSTNEVDASFKSSTYVRGTIVYCYLRLDGAYYRMRERDSTPHATLIRKACQYLILQDQQLRKSKDVPGL